MNVDLNALETLLGRTTIKMVFAADGSANGWCEPGLEAEVQLELERLVPADCRGGADPWAANREMCRTRGCGLYRLFQLTNEVQQKIFDLQGTTYKDTAHPEPVRVYHGCPQKAVEPIAKNHFDPSLAERGLWCTGTYLSPDSEVATGYGFCVFVCSAYYGNRCVGQQGVTPAQMGVDSTFNSETQWNEEGALCCFGNVNSIHKDFLAVFQTNTDFITQAEATTIADTSSLAVNRILTGELRDYARNGTKYSFVDPTFIAGGAAAAAAAAAAAQAAADAAAHAAAQAAVDAAALAQQQAAQQQAAQAAPAPALNFGAMILAAAAAVGLGGGSPRRPRWTKVTRPGVSLQCTITGKVWTEGDRASIDKTTKGLSKTSALSTNAAKNVGVIQFLFTKDSKTFAVMRLEDPAQRQLVSDAASAQSTTFVDDYMDRGYSRTQQGDWIKVPLGSLRVVPPPPSPPSSPASPASPPAGTAQSAASPAWPASPASPPAGAAQSAASLAVASPPPVASPVSGNGKDAASDDENFMEGHCCANAQCVRESYDGRKGNFCCVTCETSGGSDHGPKCQLKHEHAEKQLVWLRSVKRPRHVTGTGSAKDPFHFSDDEGGVGPSAGPSGGSAKKGA